MPSHLKSTFLYALLASIFAISLIILVLTIELMIWTGSDTVKSLSTTIGVSAAPHSTSNTYTIPLFPSSYAPAELICLIVDGVGGVVDSVLLTLGFIYIKYRCRARGKPVTKWLWYALLFVGFFSIARSIVGFVGSFASYYTSGTFTPAPSAPTQGNSSRRYVSLDGKSFSAGAWVCQVRSSAVDSDSGVGSHAKLSSLCAMDQAARSLSVILFVAYCVLTWIIETRYREDSRTQRQGWSVEGPEEQVNIRSWVK